MSYPVSPTPQLPYPSGNTLDQLAAFDQDLVRALWQTLTDMARRINSNLPKDGQEPATGLIDFQGGITVTGGATVDTISITNGVTLPLSLKTTTNVAVVTVPNSTNGSIELGRADNTASTPFIDFHSGATSTDYDARIITSGGDGTNGHGVLNVYALPVSLLNGQLKFPATQVPSSDVNTLDDYEEGTWTPQLQFGGASTGITYSTQIGQYMKVGKLVFLQCDVILSSKGTATGVATITGMPFVAGSTNNSLQCSFFVGMSGLTSPVLPLINTVIMSLRHSNATTVVALTDTNFTDNSRLIISGTFMAAN